MDTQPVPAEQTQPTMVEKPRSAADLDVEQNKDMAALSYVWILSVAVYFSRKNSPFIRFHARQGVILFALSVGAWLVPVIGKLLELIVLGLCVYGFISAAQGKRKKIPIIYALSTGDLHGAREGWKSLIHSIANLFHRRPGKSDANPAQSTPTHPSDTSL